MRCMPMSEIKTAASAATHIANIKAIALAPDICKKNQNKQSIHELEIGIFVCLT